MPHANKSLTKPLELVIVGAAPFQYLTKQKNVEIFAISMQNIKYSLNMAEKPIFNLATEISECYHNFLNVFSKETLNKNFLHLKYDYKIELIANSSFYASFIVVICFSL